MHAKTRSVEYLGAADQVWIINKDGTVVSESPEIAIRHAKHQNIVLHDAGGVLHSVDESDGVAVSEKGEPQMDEDDEFAEEKPRYPEAETGLFTFTSFAAWRSG